jgi:hypothetical protein
LVRLAPGPHYGAPGGLIRLKEGLTAAEELSVLAHEAAHEALHQNRDDMPNEKKIRETEADAVAFVVCHAIVLDTNSASSDYIQLYIGLHFNQTCESTFVQLAFQPNRDLQEYKMLTKDISAKLAEKDQQITFGPIAEA